MHLNAVLDRLEEIEQEIRRLRTEVEKTLTTDGEDETELFLRKCSGWQDAARTPDELIAKIYASRSSSLRGTELSDG